MKAVCISETKKKKRKRQKKTLISRIYYLFTVCLVKLDAATMIYGDLSRITIYFLTSVFSEIKYFVLIHRLANKYSGL